MPYKNIANLQGNPALVVEVIASLGMVFLVIPDVLFNEILVSESPANDQNALAERRSDPEFQFCH